MTQEAYDAALSNLEDAISQLHQSLLMDDAPEWARQAVVTHWAISYTSTTIDEDGDVSRSRFIDYADQDPLTALGAFEWSANMIKNTL